MMACHDVEALPDHPIFGCRNCEVRSMNGARTRARINFAISRRVINGEHSTERKEIFADLE